MTAKELAGIFRMSVKDMCDLTGFSRSGLNEIASGRSTKNGRKKKEAILKLYDRDKEMLNADLKVAEENMKRRSAVLKEVFAGIN